MSLLEQRPALRRSTLNLHRLAWDLVDQHRPALSECELGRMFLQLGVGDYSRVIRTVLEASESSTGCAQPLPIRLVDEILMWVEGYSTHADYGRLRELVVAAALR